MRIRPFLIIAFLITISTGCSFPQQSLQSLQAPNPEKPIAAGRWSTYHALRDNLDLSQEFHDRIIHNSLTLPIPGYMLAIEKADIAKIGETNKTICPDGQPCFRYQALLDAIEASKGIGKDVELTIALKNTEKHFDISAFWAGGQIEKSIFISHIAKFCPDESDCVTENYAKFRKASVKPLPPKTCLFYDVFGVEPQEHCADNRNAYSSNELDLNKGVLDLSAVAIEALVRDLQKTVIDKKITHVIIATMGWNTSQIDAYQNLHDILSNTVLASAIDRECLDAKTLCKSPKSHFSPLVIGISWPSYWPTPVIDFGNKADDGDEIGVAWGAYLVQKVLNSLENLPKASTPKTVLIGHSLGTRLLSRASYSCDWINLPQKSADLLIGLEGAFSINRYLHGTGIEGHLYRQDNSCIKKAVYTNTATDSALTATSIYNAIYIGTAKAYQMARANKETFNTCFYGTANNTCDFKADALLAKAQTKTPPHPLIIATDNIVTENQPGTGGDTHSDIYDLEMGKLIWALIDAYAPGPTP